MGRTLIGKISVARGRHRRLIFDSGEGVRVPLAVQQGMQVFPGDKVRAELVRASWTRGRRRGDFYEAQVLTVLERGKGAVLGTYHASHRRAWVIPTKSEQIGMITVEPRSDIREGSVVAVDLGTSPGLVSGKILAAWPDRDDPRTLVEQLIYERNLPAEFPRAVVKEAEDIPSAVPKAEIQSRADLRGLEVVVIDPADAKDHDDGVSWEPKGGGGRLGVHIADVTHYVTPGGALDREAYSRAVSVYLTGRVLPMLPPRLSSDLCSLLEGKDRLAHTIFLDIDSAGRIGGGEIVRSLIRPSASIDYEAAQKAIDGKGPEKPWWKAVRRMNAVAAKLREARFAAGSLDFSLPETKVMLNDAGEPVDVQRKVTGASNWLIEEFMIAANRFAGARLSRAGLGIWRVHEPPSVEDVAELEEFLKGMGIRIRRGIRSADMHPRDFQDLLERFKGTPEEYVVHRKVLQSLKLAVYSERNAGHFGLAISDYTHFTSPIRRYADLVVHRLLKAEPEGGGRAYSLKQLREISAQVSEREREAQEAEWDCQKRMVLWYLGKHIGEEYEGVISRLERFGMFVELSKVGVEGLLRMGDLGRDMFRVARNRVSMRGKRSGKVLKVGQEIRVITVRVDRESGQVDLALAD